MAISLSSGISASATKIPVTNGTQTEFGATVKVGTEFMFVRQASANQLVVNRGQRGSTPAVHQQGAAVTEVASGNTNPPTTTYLTLNFA